MRTVPAALLHPPRMVGRTGYYGREHVARLLTAAGWEVAPEVSFSIYGERGVIDVLARHPTAGSLLVSAWFAIRRKDVPAHRARMLAAVAAPSSEIPSGSRNRPTISRLIIAATSPTGTGECSTK